jgi:hypothetical protein
VLKNTSTSSGALATKVLRNGDVERGLGGRNARSAGSVDVPRDQGSTDDGVGGGINDRNVGSTLVGSADFKLNRDLLTRSERLNEILVVLVLETLALPDLALLGVVISLGPGNLELSLDVSVVVTSYLASVSSSCL